MRSRLAADLAADKRAVERDRRRPPVGVDKPTRPTTAPGDVIHATASDSGSTAATASAPVTFAPGLWVVTIRGQTTTGTPGVLAVGVDNTVMARVPLTGDGLSVITGTLAGPIFVSDPSLLFAHASSPAAGGLTVDLTGVAIRVGALP